MADDGLTIRDVARATGVGEATLRAWERRYGFPTPQRLPGGHRRYSPADVEALRRALAERGAGVELPTALARAQRETAAAPESLYAELRRSEGRFVAVALAQRELAAVSRAIEDEAASHGERGVLVGAFQTRGRYETERARWRDLARGSRLTLVFADFDRPRLPANAPAEVPLDGGAALAREWAVVYRSASFAALAVGRERPGQDVADSERVFDALLSVDAGTARAALTIVRDLARRTAPAAAEALARELDALAPARPPDADAGLALLARTLTSL